MSGTLTTAEAQDPLMTSPSAPVKRAAGQVISRAVKAPFLRFLQARADARANPDVESTDWGSLGFDSYGQWRKQSDWCNRGYTH
jgi:hypothetical protein